MGLPAGRALRLAESLKSNMEAALLYRRLGTLRRDVPLKESLYDLEWRGARAHASQGFAGSWARLTCQIESRPGPQCHS